MKNYLKKFNLLLKVSFLLSISTQLYSKEYNSQIHTGIGFLSASFSGPTTGSISIPMALSFEYELINTANKSYFFENIIAIDSEDSKTKYYATHFGSRYYFFSSNLSATKSSHGTSISIIPKIRYYGGWQLGVAQVVISSLGPVLDAVSTVFEYGAHVGMIYQVGENWGLESKFSYSMGNGFSSVTVNSQVSQLFVGGAYYF